MRLLTLTFVLAAGVALASSAPGQPAPPPPGDARQGARDYHETGCDACHGTVGQGAAWQGPRLAPRPMPYPLFLAQLRRPVRSMPRYSAEVLSDAEAAGIYAYLQTIGPTGAAR